MRVSRCNRIIDYEQPTPKPSEHKKGERKKQKRRKDIKFCPTDTTGRHCKTWNFRMKERLQREAARRVAESMMTRPISPSA